MSKPVSMTIQVRYDEDEDQFYIEISSTTLPTQYVRFFDTVESANNMAEAIKTMMVLGSDKDYKIGSRLN